MLNADGVAMVSTGLVGGLYAQIYGNQIKFRQHHCWCQRRDDAADSDYAARGGRQDRVCNYGPLDESRFHTATPSAVR